MATATPKEVHYPDSDGQPVGETEIHRDNLLHVIEMLRLRFEDDPLFYVTGNMFLYYVLGDRRRHLSPDVFVVKGVRKEPPRRYYLLWEEGKGPDLVIEFTSQSTREEDIEDKFGLYQNTLKVKEYFLFDPYAEYLKPSLQGFRLERGRYVPIKRVRRRLPSEVLGLQLERVGWELRFYDPATGKRLPNPREQLKQAQAAQWRAEEARQQAEEDWQQAQQAQRQAEEDRQQAQQAQRQAEEDRQQAQQAQRQAEEDRQQAQQAQRQAEEDRQQAKQDRQQAEKDRQQAQQAQHQAEAARQQAEAEAERLRRELDTLRRAQSRRS